MCTAEDVISQLLSPSTDPAHPSGPPIAAAADADSVLGLAPQIALAPAAASGLAAAAVPFAGATLADPKSQPALRRAGSGSPLSQTAGTAPPTPDATTGPGSPSTGLRLSSSNLALAEAAADTTTPAGLSRATRRLVLETMTAQSPIGSSPAAVLNLAHDRGLLLRTPTLGSLPRSLSLASDSSEDSSFFHAQEDLAGSEGSVGAESDSGDGLELSQTAQAQVGSWCCQGRGSTSAVKRPERDDPNHCRLDCACAAPVAPAWKGCLCET